MELCIWFKDGKTAYFHEVEVLEETPQTLAFTYWGVASQKRKYAKFNPENISGHSYSVEG